MQTAQIIPFPQTTMLQMSGAKPVIDWIYPGKVIEVAPEIHASIRYDCIDDQYRPRFKFWYQGQPVKDYPLDENNQINMQFSCRRIITLLMHRVDITGRPTQSQIEIKQVPYSWER